MRRRCVFPVAAALLAWIAGCDTREERSVARDLSEKPAAANAAPETPAAGGALTPDELAERSIHRRAVEAVIWGMPAVNYERMLQAARA